MIVFFLKILGRRSMLLKCSISPSGRGAISVKRFNSCSITNSHAGATITNAWLYLRPHLTSHTEVPDGSLNAKDHTSIDPHHDDNYGAHDFYLARVTDGGFNNIVFRELPN